MILLKHRYLIAIIPFFIIILIAGCEFNDPYVPDSAGSSTLTGRIITDPAMDLNGVKVLLSGQDSFATVTDAGARFSFQDIPPGNYTLHVEKEPYLQDNISVNVRKSTDEDIGDLNFKLKGALVGTIPNDKIAIISGEVEITVYVDDVPLVIQPDSEDKDFTVDLTSSESTVSIQAETKITVFIDSVPYSAIVQDSGSFMVEFVPPGVYSDIRVKVNSGENAIPIVSGGPVVVTGGQTRTLSSGL